MPAEVDHLVALVDGLGTQAVVGDNPRRAATTTRTLDLHLEALRTRDQVPLSHRSR